jgi:signal transduction histidine kinase/PAS domain-containing protein
MPDSAPPLPLHLPLRIGASSASDWLRHLSRFAWLPAPLLLAAISAVWLFDVQASYDSPQLMLLLNLTCTTVAALVVALLVSRSFLTSGAPGLVWIVCGVLIWGGAGPAAMAAGLSGSLAHPFNANLGITIYNSCALLAAVCHLVGALPTLRPVPALRAPLLWLTASVALASGAIAAVVLGAQHGWMPVFFVPGRGGSAARWVVLSAAILLFSMTAIILRRSARKAPAAFTHWYAHALTLIAVGLFGVLIMKRYDGALGWLGRSAQYLSGAFMVLAAVVSARDSGAVKITLGETLTEKRHQYALAFAVVGAAAGIRFAFMDALGTRLPFVTFYPAVMLAALYGGQRAGWFATALSISVAMWFWMEPLGHLGPHDLGDLLGLSVFAMTSALGSWIVETMHRAQSRAQSAELQVDLARQRREAAEELGRSEARFHDLFQNMTHGCARSRMVFVDGEPCDFTFQSVNPAFERITGLKNVEGCNINDVFPALRELNPEIFQKYGRVASTGEPAHFEMYSVGIDTWLSISVYCPAPGEFVTILENIHERKLAEEALRSSEEKLRHVRQMESVGRLAAGLAHEYNNMMAVVIGYAEMAQLQLAPDAPLSAEIRTIKEAGERAASLTAQVLAFSRKQVLRPRLLSLNDAVENLRRMLQQLIGSRIRLRAELAPELWQIQVDPAQMDVAIVNLVVNARDAMSHGGELVLATRNVLVDEHSAQANPELEPGPYVLMTVTDSGIGMAPEIQDRIFEPFFTTKDVGQGTGLGLSAVHGFVKQSGGCIQVESQPDAGSTFRVYLPGNMAQPIVRESQLLPPGTHSGHETILLVEDEPSLRALIRTVLELRGYRVLEAQSGQEALHVSAQSQVAIDLLLTDLMMPEMSGMPLAEQLGKARPGLKIVYMSGFSEQEAVQQGILASGAEFLQKPFQPQELARRIRAVLETPGVGG